jgi:hypothetical protein
MEQEARSPEFSASLLSASRHSSAEIRHASRVRTKWLPWFAAADPARDALLLMHGSPSACIPRPIRRLQAIEMLSALLGAFNAKSDDVMLAMVDKLESGGELAAASDMAMQRPLYVSAVSLALACRTLIATTKFRPQPAELCQACRDADYKIGIAQGVTYGTFGAHTSM